MEQPTTSFHANNLANVCKYTISKKKLSDVELDSIKNDVKKYLRLELQEEWLDVLALVLSPADQDIVISPSLAGSITSAQTIQSSSHSQLC